MTHAVGRPSGRSVPTLVREIAGPVLIVVAVLVVMRAFAFGGMITTQHVDVLSFWLPVHCTLGNSVAAGHVPAWNPDVMVGAPFVADPQSGWMSLPTMLLYSALPCGAAIRWFIVLQPIIAGVGLYAFLRSEGLSRPSGTTGGLLIALGLSGTLMAIAIPFSAAFAWTCVLLFAASRLLRADAWPRRLLWVIVTALVWGQMAVAHFSNGLVIGTMALVVFLVARGGVEIRRGRLRWTEAVALLATLGAALVLVNLASLLPRLDYLSRINLNEGYTALDQESNLKLYREGRGVTVSTWPLRFATSPGAYFGAIALSLSFAGLWSRRFRHLAVGFATFAVALWLVSLQPVSNVIGKAASAVPLGDQLYSHQPWRFALGTLLAVPILGALGVEAWTEPVSRRRRAAMIVPGVLLFGVLPVAFGVPAARLTLLAAGALLGACVLVAAALRSSWIVLVPVLVAGELVVNALAGQTLTGPPAGQAALSGVLPAGLGPMFAPTVPDQAYLRPGPFVPIIAGGGGRYLVWGRYHPMVAPEYWPALADQRAMLFDLEDVDVYNPAQPLRYWNFVRAANTRAASNVRMKYNQSRFVDPTNATMDLLGVRWIVAASRVRPRQPWRSVARDGDRILYERRGPPPRATAMWDWTVVGSPLQALGAVTSTSFDPSERLFLEQDPGIAPGTSARDAPTPQARYEQRGPEMAIVEVTTALPAVVLIRNGYDPHWHATVDGEPSPVLAGDYLMQAVAVPAGHHLIELRYDDPSIRRGLVGSAVAIALLLGADLLLVVLARRRRARVSEAPSERSA